MTVSLRDKTTWIDALDEIASDSSRKRQIGMFALRASLRNIPLLSKQYFIRSKRSMLYLLALHQSGWSGSLTSNANVIRRSQNFAKTVKESASDMRSISPSLGEVALSSIQVVTIAPTVTRAALFVSAAEAVTFAASRLDGDYKAGENAAGACVRDIEYIARSKKNVLEKAPLWFESTPINITGNWETLKTELSRGNEDWDVWTEWYDARMRGGPTHPNLSPAANERIEVARVLEIEDEDWEQGPAHVNAKIKAIIERETEQDRLERQQERETPDPVGLGRDETIDKGNLPKAEQPFSERAIGTINRLQQSASPTVGVNASKQLDAQPNRHTDVTADTASLIGLPERQCAVIATILSDLPQNTPRHLRTSLGQYSAHLEKRRYQPIVGLLDDQSKIIKKAVGSGDAAAWLEDGQKEAFRLFQANHRTIKQTFPLSAEREKTFASTPLDEDAITPEAVKPILDKLDEAVDEAHSAGAVSDDYKITSHQLTDNLRVAAADQPAPAFVATEDDRFQVSTKKRATFSSISYYYETYRVASTMSSDPAIALATVMAWALRELLRIAGI